MKLDRGFGRDALLRSLKVREEARGLNEMPGPFASTLIPDTPFIRYTNGVGVGEIAASNDDLTLYEGVALSAPFRNVLEPRMWNGDFFMMLFRMLQVVTLRPISKEALDKMGSGQDGIMFDVLAYQDINLTAFDLHLFDLEKVGVQIYTKKGSFDVSGKTCDDWKLVGDFEVEGQRMNAAMKVMLGSKDAVSVKSHRCSHFILQSSPMGPVCDILPELVRAIQSSATVVLPYWKELV
jgi:hypothetical protein